MNRWLTRKKDGDEPVSGKKAKKGKKGQEEVKPEFNLDAALPKVDDFRTSLIMPGLSTRFSMLREQDDPSSKIGKASDDSVLSPKRQSRLHEFGFIPGGLSDIAEVASLNGSVRRPIANERQNSFDSREEDDGGSMMSRARPGEGNVLFGGRQKIYMISNNSTKGLGRTLYDDDVNMSAYQKKRQEEKDLQRQQEAEEQAGMQSEPSSPSATSRKRDSSSTNSGTVHQRTSTAATSIASQGANSVAVSSPSYPTFNGPISPPEMSRSTAKPRRLYDQGLDLQMQEQQSSSMNRLNSIQRTRAPTGRSTPPLPFQARSATNLNDRFNSRGPPFRSESPVGFNQSAMSRNNSSAESSPVLTQPQSPLLTSPITSDSEEAQTLNAALQPNDRGKATAMGAFNKPKEAFSEQQYAERLRHLHRERDAPEATPAPKVEKSLPRKPSLKERAIQEKRRRAESFGTEQRPESPTEPVPAPSAFSRFQAAANQMKVAGPASPYSPPEQPEQDSEKVERSCDGVTFFTSQESSEDEEVQERPSVRALERTRRFDNLPTATGPAPSLLEHPALRSRSASRAAPEDRIGRDQSPRPLNADVDSPTLGPDNGGLSGLIRQHLRNPSTVSSNYGETDHAMMSPPITTAAGLALRNQELRLQPQQPGSENVTPAPSTYSHSNPWDLDDLDNPYRDERQSFNSTSQTNGDKAKAQDSASTTEETDLTPRRNHERVASNETEADHEAFQRDLAQRQRVIQENLRARAEGRSLSPAPAPGSGGGLKTALNMLRAKSSRESFATVERIPELPVRRKLTLGTASRNASSTSLANQADQVRSDIPLRNKPSRVLQQSGQDAKRERSRQRSGTDSSRTGRSTGRSPPLLENSTRDRSGSGTSGDRSRSRPREYRPGEYRDDLDQAMGEGSRSAYPPNTQPSTSGYSVNPTPPLPAERPSLDSQGRMRSRSNSRTTAANYFDSKHLQPIKTGTGSGNASPRLGLPKYSPGIPISPRPSPGGYNSALPSPLPAFSATNTPPISNPTTPNTAAFNPSAIQPMIRQGMLRKKSIAKSDISEPVFLSTTSVIDTVNLPAGASLKNGIEYDTPPVPPINPMRKRFGFGRERSGTENHNPYDPAIQPGYDAPRAPFAEPMRTNSSDALASQASQSRTNLRKTSSEGKSLRGPPQAQPSPALPQGGLVGRNNSPPRPSYEQAVTQRPMDGAMF
jgi:hypothetical protein